MRPFILSRHIDDRLDLDSGGERHAAHGWLSAIALYVLLILYTRLVGLRSFSKMSGFDFTITIGSVLASVTLWQKPTLLEGAVALGVLFGLQFAVRNLRRANMTETDLQAKLRAANVTQLEQVRAVVVESTGDVSVLHAPPDAPAIDDTLLADVKGESRQRTGRKGGTHHQHRACVVLCK